MSLTALFYLLVYFTGIIKSLTGKPVYGLYAYFFSFYFHAPTAWWGQSLPDLRWSFTAAIVTFISILLHKQDTGLKVFEYKENRYFALFIVYVLLQWLWALNSNLHEEYMILVVKFFILIVIIQNAIRTRNDIIGFVVINLLGSCYYVYVGVSAGVVGRMETVGTPGMEDANLLGQHLAAVLVLSAYLLFINYGKVKYLLIPFILFVLNGVFLTGSRGAIISLVMTILASLLIIPQKFKKSYFTYLILAIFGGSLLLGEQILDRFEQMLPSEQGVESDKSTQSRWVIIDAQFEMFKNNPLFGYGHRGTLLLSDEYIPKEYLTTTETGKTVRASHNFIMSILVDHGIVGAFFYSIVIFSALTRIFKVRKYSNKLDSSNTDLVIILTGCTLSLFSFMVSGLGSNNKKLELGIWLFAIIPLLYSKIMSNNIKDSKTV